MHETNMAPVDAFQSSNNAGHPYGTADCYKDKPSQFAPWHVRLRRRRYTFRNLGLYVLVALVLILASPIVPTFIVGAAIVAAGLALRIWTFGHLQKNVHMVTSGPYAYTRNPAYLGSFIITCGFVLAAGNPYTPAGLVVWGLGVISVIVFFRRYLPRKYALEYPRLESLFPEGYREHAAHVPNFLPRLTPWRSGDETRFSWACVRANHELWWPAALALGLALVWVS